MFRILTLLGALLIGATQGASPAMAQEFPKKQPIKIVVAVPAGGLTDTLARITADFLQRRLSQAVVVENRPGASSTIGADYVAKSPADGYTLLLAGAEQPVVAAVRGNLPYKLEDFTYLIRPFTTQPLILVGPKSAFSSTTDLVAYMKANPRKLRYGSTGVGAINHVGTAMFEGAAGVKGVHVTYTGIGPVYTDLLAGNVDFTVGGAAPVPDGLKVLGPSGTRRHPLYPNLPTLEELGIKNAGWDLWFGFLAPPNLPKPIADRLIAELGALFKDPEAIAKFQSAAKSVPEANPLIGDEFKKRVVEEQVNWKAVADREKIVVQQ
jgi:tripartite-type tricarboxylate transporter receptor subunit TctC